MIPITALQQDALSEIFNLGTGRAAASLSQIMNEPIGVSVPHLEVTRRDAFRTRLETEGKAFGVVFQDLNNPFAARSLLILPEDNARTIVSHMLGGLVDEAVLAECEEDAMGEFGNIVLHACVSALADQLKATVTGGLPAYQRVDRPASMLPDDANDQDSLLVLQVQLTLRDRRLDGQLMLVLSAQALENLLPRVDQFLRQRGLH